MYKLIVIFLFLLFSTQSFGSDNFIELKDNKVRQFPLGISSDTHNVQISISESSEILDKYLFIQKANIDYLKVENQSTGEVFIGGQSMKDRIGFSDDPYFYCSVNMGDMLSISIKSNEQIILPVSISSLEEIHSAKFYRDVLSGVFLGILFALFFYNLILYFFLKDTNYLYYILYLFFIGVAQLDIIGFNYYFFRDMPKVSNVIMHYCSGLSGIFAMLFFQRFMGTKLSAPKGHIVLSVIAFIYFLVIVTAAFGSEIISYKLIQFGGLSLPASLFIAISLAIKGNSSGRYVAIAWSLLIFGATLYALKDFGIIPFNVLTNYALAMGVVVQVILISVALANQINKLNSEKEMANERIVKEVTKNEELVQNQNITLEKKVEERTAELQKALDNLRETQSHLVQSEKMASLGTLTAGIAHEINNPINFVSANVMPLRDNITDITNLIKEYKSIDFRNLKSELVRLSKLEEELELDYMLNETKELIDGIEEGANRTHTIVEGLTTFSRGDSGTKTKANINKGIKSTVSVLKSRLNDVNLSLDLEKELPTVVCEIGKINQVVLNLLNNALDALEEKNGPNSPKSELRVKSWQMDGTVKIQVKDNGDGMSAETQKKVMEPFYTTKPVGKGTGLGLSISYSIIKEHEGTVDLISKEGEGTSFVVTLPLEPTSG